MRPWLIVKVFVLEKSLSFHSFSRCAFWKKIRRLIVELKSEASVLRLPGAVESSGRDIEIAPPGQPSLSEGEVALEDEDLFSGVMISSLSTCPPWRIIHER